jgi:hypothetical protein
MIVCEAFLRVFCGASFTSWVFFIKAFLYKLLFSYYIFFGVLLFGVFWKWDLDSWDLVGNWVF